MTPPKNILEADGIMVSYGSHRVLSGIYLRCEQGQIVGMLGRNGCGKSTLFKVMMGALSAESKSVRINGTALYVNGQHDRSITFLPQESFIPSYVSIRQALRLYQVDEAAALASFPELEECFSRKAHQLSGGQLRLVELMLVLFTPSKFCLLDEPFSGLTPLMIERLTTLFQQIKVHKGLIITDHLYRNVLKASDRLYVLVNGQSRLIQDVAELVGYGYVKQ